MRQPTLILAGSDDRIVPLANADLLAWAIPDSRKHCFDDGHLFLITDPAVLGGGDRRVPVGARTLSRSLSRRAAVIAICIEG